VLFGNSGCSFFARSLCCPYPVLFCSLVFSFLRRLSTVHESVFIRSRWTIRRPQIGNIYTWTRLWVSSSYSSSFFNHAWHLWGEIWRLAVNGNAKINETGARVTDERH
jgi:hypothetical protein